MSLFERRSTLAEEAYNQIKNALCRGEFAPGDVLSENHLASKLSMSRTPIREAVRMLENEGWLQVRNGVGIYVRPLSSKDIEDLYEVRCLLEAQAAKTAVFHITDQEIEDMENRFRQQLKRMEDGEPGNISEFSTLDWEIHTLIVSRCQNSYIRSIMRSNTENLRRYQRLSVEATNDLRESTRQHLNLLAVMRLRDPELLSDALAKHLNWASSLVTVSRRVDA